MIYIVELDCAKFDRFVIQMLTEHNQLFNPFTLGQVGAVFFMTPSSFYLTEDNRVITIVSYN